MAEASRAPIRSVARDIFLHALSQANIDNAFDKYVACEGGALRLGPDLYNLRDYSRVFVVSIGKAGHTMAEALVARVGRGSLKGIVVCPVDPVMLPGFEYFRGGHPLPNEISVKAGQAVLRALRGMDERSLVIYMISGGASALCEKPISDDISLADLIQTYRVLVHSGAPIAEINAIRKHLSALKGGRMAQAAHPARQVAILISDVPDSALGSLASGPTMPDSTTVDDCYSVAEKYGMAPEFPESVRWFFEHHALEETPKSGDEAFVNTRSVLVASNAMALNYAAEKARASGFVVSIDNSCDDWDYAAAGDYLLNKLRELRKSSPRVCLISGGEVTVKVTGGGGEGGRNQQIALYLTPKIAGENITVLSAGTDGIDGNSPAAGAVVDGTTMERALALGLSPVEALTRFNAYPLFDKLGDAIMTGPTGNNVRDLRLLIAY
jgi:glycerate 2-kinase